MSAGPGKALLPSHPLLRRGADWEKLAGEEESRRETVVH